MIVPITFNAKFFVYVFLLLRQQAGKRKLNNMNKVED